MKKIIAALAAYVATILVANYVTTNYGMWPIVPGVLEATAGTYFIGVLFILRDYIQDTAGKLAVVGAIGLGSLLSWQLAAPALVVASVVAFAVAELTDFAIYTPLRKRGYVRAALASNSVSAVVDTVLFLWIAAPVLTVFNPAFSIGAALPGQIVGKVLLTLVVVGLVVAHRTFGRRAVTA